MSVYGEADDANVIDQGVNPSTRSIYIANADLMEQVEKLRKKQAEIESLHAKYV